MLSREQALRSLRLVAGSASSGYLAISWKAQSPDAKMRTEYFAVADIEAAADLAMQLAPEAHVYVNSGLLGSIPTSGRGSNADVTFSAISTLDYDVGDEGHKQALSRPDSKDDVHGFLEELPGPTAIMDSGNGLLVIWTLDTPFQIESEEDRREAAQLQKDFQAYVRHHAKNKFGWELDKTSDLARLVRVGGTQNHKSDPAKPVAFWPDSKFHAGPPLSQAQMRAAAASISPRAALRRAPVRGFHADAAETETSQGRQPVLESIVAGCAFMDHWEANAAVLTEPEWKAGIDIAVPCIGSRRQIHKISSAYPGYSKEETDAKVDRALEGPPPRTCENIASEVGFDGCDTCLYRGQFASPIGLGYKPAALASIGRRYVFIAARDAFLDLGADA